MVSRAGDVPIAKLIERSVSVEDQEEGGGGLPTRCSSSSSIGTRSKKARETRMAVSLEERL